MRKHSTSNPPTSSHSTVTALSNSQKEHPLIDSLLTFQISKTTYNPYTNTISRVVPTPLVPNHPQAKRRSKSDFLQHQKPNLVLLQNRQVSKKQQFQASQTQHQHYHQLQHKQSNAQHYQQQQTVKPQFSFENQQQKLPPLSALQSVPQSTQFQCPPSLQMSPPLQLNQQLHSQPQQLQQSSLLHHDSQRHSSLPQRPVKSATLPQVQKHTYTPRHERCSLFDTYSFFFEEQDHLDNNAIETAQKSWHYHQHLFDSFLVEHIIPLSDKAYTIDQRRAPAINRIMFGDDSTQYLSSEDLTRHARYTWHGLETASTVLHRPTFDINAVDITLAATLVYIGMATASNNRGKYQFIYRNLVHKSLSQLSLRRKSHSFYENLNYYQALTFLCWYNYELALTTESLHPDMEEVSAELYRYVMIGSAFHAGKDSEIHLGNAVVNSDAYTLFPTTDPTEQKEQWLTWITHESFVRAAYFCSISEVMRKFVTQSKSFDSVVDFDFIMICPLPLWRSTSTEMFFHVVGPPRSILTVSYLLLLKSMLRLPTIFGDGTKENGFVTIDGKNGWTIGHLHIIIYGLATIGWVVKGCTYYQQMHKSQKLLNVKDNSDQNKTKDMESSYSNRNIFKNRNNTLQDSNPLSPEEEYASDTSSNSPTCINTLSTVVDIKAQSRLFQALEMLANFTFQSSSQFMNPQLSKWFTSQQTERLLEHARKQSNMFGLSSMWNESEAFIPWDGLCGLSLHFQTCYFSIYTEGDFERHLVETVAENLKQLVQMRTTGESRGWTTGQVETFIMFGVTPPQMPTAEQIEDLKRWTHKDLTFNKMAISGFYLVNLLNSSTPATFGAAETVYARSLLVPAGLIVWAYDFYFRFTLGGAEYEKTTAYTPYYQDCIHSADTVDVTKLHRQHFPIVYSAWHVMQGRLVNPIEDDGVSNLMQKLTKGHFSKTTFSLSTMTSNDEGNKISWYDIQRQTDWCNIYTFFGLMNYLDERKLKADPICPDNEILKNAKLAL